MHNHSKNVYKENIFQEMRIQNKTIFYGLRTTYNMLPANASVPLMKPMSLYGNIFGSSLDHALYLVSV